MAAQNRNGSVFAITAAGKLTTLYSFCAQTDCTDGSFPNAAMVQAANGKFYGSTDFGGTYNRGTMFSITTTACIRASIQCLIR